MIKKYCYCFNSVKEPSMTGNVKYTVRKLKEPTKYNKETNSYMHLYTLENEKYVLTETKCLNWFMRDLAEADESFKRNFFNTFM